MNILPRQPDHFRVIGGDVPLQVQILANTPQFAAKPAKVRGARAQGIRYEAKVHEYMQHIFNGRYLPNPWFSFVDLNGQRWCQPDGLIIDLAKRLITIVEIKYSHTGEAWWKLKHLYLPVLRAYYGDAISYKLLEIVKWYDSGVIFPEHVLCSDTNKVPDLPNIGVHIYHPRGKR